MLPLFAADTTSALTRLLPGRSRLARVVTECGSPFLEALHANIREAAPVLGSNTNLHGRLCGRRQDGTASALSEVWLVANLLRAGNAVKAVAPDHDRRPDYQVVGPAAPFGLLLEVKRLTELPGPDGPDSADESYGFVPSTLVGAGFPAIAGLRVKRAASQLNSLALTLGPSPPRQAVAIDVTLSHDLQRLLVTDFTDDALLLAEVQRAAGTHRQRPILLFVVSYRERVLYHARWLGSPEA